MDYAIPENMDKNGTIYFGREFQGYRPTVWVVGERAISLESFLRENSWKYRLYDGVSASSCTLLEAIPCDSQELPFVAAVFIPDGAIIKEVMGVSIPQ